MLTTPKEPRDLLKVDAKPRDDTSAFSLVHLLGFLELYDHTPPVQVRKAFKELRDAADAVGDPEFLQFLDAVSDKFRVYLERPDPSKRKEKPNGA